MLLKSFIFLTLVLVIQARKVPKVADSNESDNSFVSKPLTYRNYKKYLASNRVIFVKFFTHWQDEIFYCFLSQNFDKLDLLLRCHFSKKIFDIWENLGEHYSNDKRILIAEMDCEPDKNKKVCKSFKVSGYSLN